MILQRWEPGFEDGMGGQHTFEPSSFNSDNSSASSLKNSSTEGISHCMYGTPTKWLTEVFNFGKFDLREGETVGTEVNCK